MRAEIKGMYPLRLIHQTCTYYQKDYCYPSQKRILERLENWYNVKISIATLNRWLLACEKLGWIKRTRRIRRDKRLGMVFQSTLYKVTIQGLFHLKRMGYYVADSLARLFGYVKQARKDGSYRQGKAPRQGSFEPLSKITDRLKILHHKPPI